MSYVVNGEELETGEEDFLLEANFSDDVPPVIAAAEKIALTDEHWEVIRFLREHYEAHGVQAQVRVMIRHFREAWGSARGTNHHLHDLFPRGGPQKQGNRLAGLLKTKGEH